MEQIKLCTDALVEAIQKSEAYQRFLDVKRKVDDHPELRTKLNDFRKRSYELQNRKDNNEFYREMERFEIEYHEIRKDPVISEFLQCEVEICRIMQHVNLKLVQAVDLDIVDFQESIK